MAQIVAANLAKLFRVPEREAGLSAALRGLLRRKYRETRAVDNVSFQIETGEIVGFLGPNGAGKTTTLKMLTGLLHPTGGEASVLGFVPGRREPDFLRQISLLMGQRSQLMWDLPPVDSFQVQAAVYRVSRDDAKRTTDELIELLDLKDVLKKPVRTLSLGERMKCELCASLIHQPRVLFLDEPTIGVDITMQARIRQFIAERNRRYGTTIMLTSHYMADVTALCKRIIVIDRGQLLFDGSLASLIEKLAPFKMISIDLETEANEYDFEKLGTVVERAGRKVVLQTPRDETSTVTAQLLRDLAVLDLTIQDPPIEDVISRAFVRESHTPAAEQSPA